MAGMAGFRSGGVLVRVEAGLGGIAKCDVGNWAVCLRDVFMEAFMICVGEF